MSSLEHEIKRANTRLKGATFVFIAGLIIVATIAVIALLTAISTDRHSRDLARQASIEGCERGNERTRESNRRIPGEIVQLDSAIVVASLSPAAFKALSVPPTPEAVRLSRLAPEDIRQIRGSLKVLPITDCELAYPPVK